MSDITNSHSPSRVQVHCMEATLRTIENLQPGSFLHCQVDQERFVLEFRKTFECHELVIGFGSPGIDLYWVTQSWGRKKVSREQIREDFSYQWLRIWFSHTWQSWSEQQNSGHQHWSSLLFSLIGQALLFCLLIGQCCLPMAELSVRRILLLSHDR